jgi:hypothetical protein
MTWARQDFHARAGSILLDARSARIAEAVAVAEPRASVRCTVCHSPLQAVAKTRLTSSAQHEEGVSCETCHGASSSWLRGHTRTDWTQENRINAGMRDLRNLYARANACVACHQTIDTDLIAAGHPKLVFELDSQSVDEPKHWHDEPGIGAPAWLTGQAVALREATWDQRNHSGGATDSEQTFRALVWLLARVTRSDPKLPEIFEPTSSNSGALQNRADLLARNAAQWKPGQESILLILRTLAGTQSEFTGAEALSADAFFYRARRVALALERLNLALATPLSLERELASLREDVRLQESFSPSRFAAHLSELNVALDKSASH